MFHADRAQAATSFHKLAALDAQIACFGHGQPLTGDAARYFREAARQLPATDSEHLAGSAQNTHHLKAQSCQSPPQGAGRHSRSPSI